MKTGRWGPVRQMIGLAVLGMGLTAFSALAQAKPKNEFAKRKPAIENVRAPNTDFAKAAKPANLENIRKAIGNAQVIIAGEEHSQLEQRQVLVDSLPVWYAAGVRKLVLEGIDIERQADLDEFMKTGEMSQALDENLGGWMRRHYQLLLYQARDLGFTHVYGARLPFEDSVKMRAIWGPGSYSSTTQSGWTDPKFVDHYNQFILPVIEKAVSDGPGRVLASDGRDHLASLKKGLEEKGIETFTIRLATRSERWYWSDGNRQPHTLQEEEVQYELSVVYPRYDSVLSKMPGAWLICDDADFPTGQKYPKRMGGMTFAFSLRFPKKTEDAILYNSIKELMGGELDRQLEAYLKAHPKNLSAAR